MITLKETLRKKFGLGYISFTQLYEGVADELGGTLNPQEVRNVFEKEVAPEEQIYYDEKFHTYKKRGEIK